MMKMIVATLALSAGLVSAEDLDALETPPLLRSIDLDFVGVQADCTVVKAAYQAAECGCDSEGVQRALEEKQSTMVALPREASLADISAARIAAAAPHDFVASSNTEWRFWLTYQNKVFDEIYNVSKNVEPNNLVDLRRVGSSVGGQALLFNGDRYHLDTKRDTSLPPKLPALADVYNPTNRFFLVNQQYVLSNADAVFGDAKAAVTSLTQTSRVYFRYIDYTSADVRIFGTALVCNGLGGPHVWESKLIAECSMWTLFDLGSGLTALGPVFHHKAWPYNYVLDKDGTYYMGASPFPADAAWVEKIVVTASGQYNVFYCADENCEATTAPSPAQLRKHVDITMSNTPWSELPDRVSYEAEAIAYKNSFSDAEGLPDPTIQNLNENQKNVVKLVLQHVM